MSAGSGRNKDNEDIVMRYDYAIFIGRLQPPHKEHIKQIQRGLEIADKVIITLGSHRAARNIKNPWTAEEREEMVRVCFSEQENERLLFTRVRDYYYNNTTWFTDLYNSVGSLIHDDSATRCIIGAKKDSSSWYLDMLPENWVRELKPAVHYMHSTAIRDLYFQNDLRFQEDLHDDVAEYLMAWAQTTNYFSLKEEWEYIREYKAEWAKTRYPVTFVTTDAVVVKNGHVLVVRRKFNPGKGLLALPGGFINQSQSILDSALRELKEETKVRVPKDTLKDHIVDQRVFDHPDRSLRGRTITHAFCIKLPDGGDLPQVKGNDDAERALWIPIADLYVREREFYEDHCHIITHFTNKL